MSASTTTVVAPRHAAAAPSQPVIDAVDWMVSVCWPEPRPARPPAPGRLLRWVSLAEVGTPATAAAVLLLAVLLTGCNDGMTDSPPAPVPASTGAVPTPALIT